MNLNRVPVVRVCTKTSKVYSLCHDFIPAWHVISPASVNFLKSSNLSPYPAFLLVCGHVDSSTPHRISKISVFEHVACFAFKIDQLHFSTAIINPVINITSLEGLDSSWRSLPQILRFRCHGVLEKQRDIGIFDPSSQFFSGYARWSSPSSNIEAKRCTELCSRLPR